MPTRNSPRLRPFVRWAGGKQNLVSQIIPFLPPVSDVRRHFEPFVGAGSLFLATEFAHSELSDINPHLINAYKAIKRDPSEIDKLLKKYAKRMSSEFYYKLRAKFNREIRETTLAQAARFIFLVHTSFNGIYRLNGRGLYNVPVGKLTPSLPTTEQLERISLRLKRARISCYPYTRILNRIEKRDFVYLDPPYPTLNGEPFRLYTRDKFKPEDQATLHAFAKKLDKKGCLVMISNADISMIRHLYSGWNIRRLNTIRTISAQAHNYKVSELIITNY